jgi:hypothetical protein
LADPHAPSVTVLPPPLDEPLLELLPLELPLAELELARLAPQLDAVPPPVPWQIQVQGPAPDMAAAVPELHRLVVGAAPTVVLLAAPQAPLTTVVTLRVDMHCAVVPPFVPAQFQLNGPLPLTLDAVPLLQRLVAGTVLKA